jgi:hypothetical protein
MPEARGRAGFYFHKYEQGSIKPHNQIDFSTPVAVVAVDYAVAVRSKKVGGGRFAGVAEPVAGVGHR